jgi:hypothetical protein
VQSNWWWWRWDLSVIAPTLLGAQELGRDIAWARPIFEAYVAGAWCLYWTDSTLYWVAKPRVSVEQPGRRLHAVDGPALESDAENLYFWHGVMVPAFVVTRPEWITLEHIRAEDNAEVRRTMVERFGEERYIAESGMAPVASDERFGDLFVERVEAGRPIARIRVTNRSPEPDGTYRRYWLRINPDHYGGDAGRIPQAAVASTWRTTRGGKELLFSDWRDYRPTIET